MANNVEEKLKDTRYRGDRHGCAYDLLQKLQSKCKGKKIEECSGELLEALANAYSNGSYEMEVLLCDM